jgi:alpha-L-arabinofuranosidase
MIAVDPTILLIASGNNHSSWTDGLLQHSSEYMDYSAEHLYALRDETNVFNHLNNVRSNLAGRIQNHRDMQIKYRNSGAEDIFMALTEYAYSEVICPSRLKDGLGIGVYMNLLINNADVVKLANYSSTVNATQGCITTTNTEAVMQGSGYALKLFRNYMESIAVTSYSQYSAELQLDVSAAISEDGETLTVAVVNPSEYHVRLQGNILTDLPVTSRYTFTGDFFDSFNSPQKAELYEIHENNEAYAVAPAMSLTNSVFDW